MKRKIISTLFALVLVFTLGLVTAVPAAADIAVNPGDSIQDAIDAASANDTIIVAAGTYTEDLTINIANLTIKSASGSGNTTIQLVDVVGIDIQGGADGFVLGGASGEGFTVLGNSENTTFNIQVVNAPSDVEISYNEIDTTGAASMGVSVGAAGASGLTISNNTFTGDDTPDGSIWGVDVVDVTVTNNVFTGSDLVSYGVQFSGITGTSLINENTVTDYKGAGAIVILSGTGVSDLTINGNTISGCANGIRFYDDSGTGDITTVTVTENTLTDNAKAIRIGDGAHIVASNFTIENNNISGSTTYGLENAHTTEQVTAENNWWGTVNGPNHADNTFNVAAQGDASSDNVDYVPWYDTDMTGTSFAPVTSDDPAEQNFSSIQAAIDAASANDTISVTDGTYTENLVIATENITVQAASSPVIDGGGMLGPGVHITAADVTFQGFTITDFTCTPDSGIGAMLVEGDGAVIDDNTIYDILPQGDPIDFPAGIGIDVHASNVEVTNNIVHDVGSIGIRVRHDWDTAPTVSNNVLLENNEVYRTANSGVLVTGYAKGVTIKTNEIYESLEPTPYNLFVHWDARDVLIENNIIRDPYNVAYGHNVVLAGCDNVTISGNTITGATSGKNIYPSEDYLPWVSPDLLSTNVNITNNDIQDGAWGIKIGYDGTGDPSLMAATTTINFNNISGNTLYGVENTIATDVDAENNWWGNASGPVDAATAPTSYGDAVSTNVDYQPWLLAEVEEGVTPTTYEYTLALKDGWTLASVDKEVATGTAWVGTTALADTETIVAYKYTAGTGYSQVTLATQLTSVDAYYVKTDDGGGVGINYSTSAPGVVTKSLGAGWNIISCAGETGAYTLLSQLRYVQVGEQEGVGITNLIGQASYNQYLPTSMSIPLVTDDEWVIISPGGTPVPLNAFDGYWVYMNAAKSFGVIPD